MLNPNVGPLVRALVGGDVFQPFIDNASSQTATDEELSGPVRLHVWDPSTAPLPKQEGATPLLAGMALTDLAFTPDGMM